MTKVMGFVTGHYLGFSRLQQQKVLTPTSFIQRRLVTTHMGPSSRAGPCLLTFGPPCVHFILRLPVMPARSRGHFQVGRVHSDARRVCWPPGPELSLSKSSQGLVDFGESGKGQW